MSTAGMESQAVLVLDADDSGKKIALTGPTTTVQQGGIGAMRICTLNGLHVVKPLMQLRTLG